MKRLLLSLVALCAVISMNAGVVEIDFSAKGFENAEVLSVLEQDGITLTFDKGTGSTAPAYYNTGTAARLYGGNTLAITSTIGDIVSIEFTVGSSNPFDSNFTFTPGNFADNVWTGSCAEMVITNGNGKGHVRIQKMSITTQSSGEVIVAKPTVSVAGGTYYEAQTVELTAEEGATIKYTLNGGEEQTYTAAITISENTTLVAWAEKDGVKSAEVTATYTFATTTTGTLASAIASADNDVTTISEALTVVYQNGAYLYVKAGDTYGLIYKQGGVGITYNAGDVIAAGVTVKKTTYNGLIELIEPEGLTEGVAGTPVEPIVTDALTCASAGWVNKYVKITEATYHADTKKLEDAEGEIAMHKSFDTALPITNMTNVTVTGIIGVYNDVYQLQPITIEGDKEQPEDPNANSADNPYTVAEILAIINTEGFEKASAYVKGVISKIDDVNTSSYGNATYYIVDPETAEPVLEVFRGYSLNGAKFTAKDEIQVNDTVVVYGDLVLYNGTTPEFTAGSQILSLKRPEKTEPDTPAVVTGDGTQENPYTVDDIVLLNILEPEEPVYAWVKGYILGSASSSTKLNDAEKAADTNIALGATADATTFIPAALPRYDGSDIVRQTLGVKTNPGNIGKEVIVYGTLEKYFSTTGIKNVSKFIIDGQLTDNIAATKANEKQNGAIYTVSGVRVEKATRGLYIIDGKKVVVK